MVDNFTRNMQTLFKKFISPENASESEMDYRGHMGVKTLLMQNSGVFVIARLFIKHYRFIFIFYRLQRSCHQAFADHMPACSLAKMHFFLRPWQILSDRDKISVH
jgi:hypothetical protein